MIWQKIIWSIPLNFASVKGAVWFSAIYKKIMGLLYSHSLLRWKMEVLIVEELAMF